MDFTSLKEWFFMNAGQLNTDTHGAYWTLKRGDRSLIHSNFDLADPEQSWSALQKMIEGEISYGGREFRVIFKKSAKDAENKCPSRVVTVPYSMNNANNQNTAAAIGSINQDFIQQSFTARLNDFEEKARIREEHLRKEFEFNDRIKELEAENLSLRLSEKTNVDRFFEILEERPKLVNQIMGVFNKRMPAVQVSGPEVLQEVPATDQEEIAASTPTNENVAVDFNLPIQAYVNMRNAGMVDEDAILRLSDAAIVMKRNGYDDPVTTIEKVVAYCRDNPAMAKSFIDGL